jgi:hypothetical protein
LLEYNPDKRLSAQQALQHPYFWDLHQPEDLYDRAELSYFDFEFEMYSLDKRIIKDLLLDEILLYNNAKARKHYKVVR